MSNRAKLSCPLCKQPVQNKFQPFCSQGCKDRDLLKWLGEGYAIKGPPAELADDDMFGDDG